ncbi:MAG: metal ABC transporter substrate-binding protein [Jiangellaceae bacterium]
MKTHSQQRRRWRRVLRVAVTGCLLSLAALAGASGLHVVVSIPPYQEVVTRLAGPDATVEVLLPPGASPHAYDPTPRDLARLEGADLVVLNGGVDAFVHTLLDGAGEGPAVFEALDALAEAAPHGTSEAGEGHEDERTDEHDDDHDQGGPNPHVWLDPVRMIDIVQALAERLADIAPERADATRAEADALVDELEALDAELRDLLAPVRGAAFVPFHDAWPHFAARYHLDLVLEIEPFPGR